MAGDQQAFTQWHTGTPETGQTNPVLGPAPAFRNQKEQQLARWGQSPDTQHPDGYLGTQGASSRRQDKLLNAVHRQNHRSYSRGVHKGERVNPGDYLWPDEFHPETGVQTQSHSLQVGNVILTPKQTVAGAEPVRLTNDGKAGPRGIPRGLDRMEMEPIDKQRASMLKGLLPRYR